MASLIQDGQQIAVNVEVSTGWPVVQAAILEVLANYPDALRAVSRRLEALEIAK